jgi:hypothetical protein
VGTVWKMVLFLENKIKHYTRGKNGEFAAAKNIPLAGVL